MTARGQQPEEDRPGTFEIPDLGALTAQLDSARAARNQLDRVIAWLEDGVALFDAPPAAPELPPAKPAKPKAPPKTKATRATSARASNRDVEAKIVSTLISASAPLSRSEIAERIGEPVGAIKKLLQRLVSAEKVIAEGVTRNRRYRVPPHAPHSEHGARTQAGRDRAAVGFDGGVARVRLRDQCMKAIAADPGALTEDRLAQSLDASRDDIAEACGWLLDRGRVALNPDGTYRRSGTREIAA